MESSNIGKIRPIAEMVCVYPHVRLHGIQPNGMAEIFCKKLKALEARFSAPLFYMYGAVRRHELIGSHAGISHQHEPCFRIEPANSSIFCGFLYLDGSCQIVP